MNKVQNNILGGKVNFFLGKQNLGLLCPNGQVPSKINVGPWAVSGNVWDHLAIRAPVLGLKKEIVCFL